MASILGFVLDKILDAEKTLGRLRKQKDPLDDVPDPPATSDPFAPKVAAIPATKEPEKPLGKPDVPAQLFGTEACPWTGRAKRLLRDRSIVFEYVDLDAKEEIKTAARLVRETSQQTTPYVYVRGEFIGGYNALDEIERLGQLEEMVKAPEDRRGAVGGVRIVVPKRGPEGRAPGESS
jgi:glutaredoxin